MVFGLLGAAVAVCGGLGGLLASTVFAAPVLDGRAVERDTSRVVVADYGQPQPKAVTCPDNTPATPGTTATCDLTTGSGLVKKIPIRVTSTDGHYYVGMPGRSSA